MRRNWLLYLGASLGLLLGMLATARGQNFSGREIAGLLISGAVNKYGADRERTNVKRSSEHYNVGQHFNFTGRTIEIRLDEDDWSSYYSGRSGRNWLIFSLRNLLSPLGAKVVWDTSQIRDESGERDYLETNRWVEGSTKPRPGTIKAAEWRLEITALMADRSEDLGLNFSQFFRGGFEVSASRQTAYAGLITTIRDRSTGEVAANYKALGTASTADRIGADIANGLFGDRFSGRYNSDGRDSLQVRAMENALSELGKVFRSKSTSPPASSTSTRAREYYRN